MKKILFTFFSFLLLSTGYIYSQGCEAPSSEEGVNIFGFIQSQYEMKFEDIQQTSFALERARLGATGNIPYDFSYYMVLEMSPFVSENPYLLDAFVTYNRFKWAKVSIGSFKTPFSMDINTSCSGLHTVYRTQAALQMVAPFRDFGLMILGGDKESFMQYSLGIMNGSGLGTFDINNSKDIAGRVVFHPVDFINVGGSFRYGKPVRADDESDRTTFGAELEINKSNFLVRAEYIGDEGAFNREAGGGCSGDLLELGEKRSGGYAMIAYRTSFNLQPVFRYETFDSQNLSGFKQSIMTYGLNYFFNDWTRLQINYLYVVDSPIEIMNDELVIQLQVKF